MICCKIVANFSSSAGSFGSLIEELANKGEFLWTDGSLFFSDTQSNTDRKILSRILRKCGYSEFFLDIYSKDNVAHESDRVDGWITDKLTKINYTQYEQTSQTVFHNISDGLDMLESRMNELQKQKDQSEQGNNKTEV